MDPRLAKIAHYLLDRYPAATEQSVLVRQSVENICKRFIASGIADPNFESELCSGNESRFWQRFTEAALTCEVLDAGLEIEQHRNGPDLCIKHKNQKVWIEFICPEPAGIPSDWLALEPSGCKNFPHEAMLLRWTSAIKEKSEKLLGSQFNGGYLQKGIVGPEDSYVIAVNGRQLRGAFAALNGISQLPFAVEAVFAVGPYQLHIDRGSLDVVREDYQHRPYVKKITGASVPAYTFLDERFSAVSAIWATDFDDCFALGNQKALAVVHNPLAINQLPAYLLPAWSEFSATLVRADEYRIDKQDGKMSPRYLKGA